MSFVEATSVPEFNVIDPLTFDQQILIGTLEYIKPQISIELIPEWAKKIVGAELSRRDTTATISELFKGVRQLTAAIGILESMGFFPIDQLQAYLINLEDSIAYKLSEFDDDGIESPDDLDGNNDEQSEQMSSEEYIAYELAWLQHNLTKFLLALSEAQELLESQHEEINRLVQRLKTPQLRELQRLLESKSIQQNFVPMSALLRAETLFIQ